MVVVFGLGGDNYDPSSDPFYGKYPAGSPQNPNFASGEGMEDPGYWEEWRGGQHIKHFDDGHEEIVGDESGGDEQQQGGGWRDARNARGGAGGGLSGWGRG